MQTIPEDSVGLVSPEYFRYDQPMNLESDKTLSGFELVFETYGELNKNKTNAVLVCPALSGHHHAAGFHDLSDPKPGWWDFGIGPGKVIDTNHFFVVSVNNLGGCHGSSGPCTINPKTGKSWGPDFPQVTVKDWTQSQALLADWLGIKRWAVVIGGSLGGMQAMQWAVDYPDRIGHAILIASAAKLSAQNIAFNEIARNAIQSDPNFCNGQYAEYGKIPEVGLKLARMVGHVTYQSDDGMRDKFGRALRTGDWELGLDVQFQVESYLQHQGSSFSKTFDANTYLLATRALDYFDPARAYNNDLVKALGQCKCAFMLISFSSDWRFSPKRSQEIVAALIQARLRVSNVVIEATSGHDAFLIPIPPYLKALDIYFQQVIKEVQSAAG